ncbi:hypothetical protein MOQ_002335 [Trypanosoma cruzi marinkellei]|uniref:Uncharacterized protein n=1 Tax=Trypanosoma cruzi marinkellei TaxID=85056 RepID=K2N7J7_TRYCR|nr:hypothetical protein MOQ_002335 [Trypanosoma cruzi marinkellei]
MAGGGDEILEACKLPAAFLNDIYIYIFVYFFSYIFFFFCVIFLVTYLFIYFSSREGTMISTGPPPERTDGGNGNARTSLFSCDGCDDMLSCFMAAGKSDRIHWEQTCLLPSYDNDLLIATFAMYRLRLALLEAKAEYFQRRMEDIMASPSSCASKQNEDEMRCALRKHTEAAIERLAEVSVSCWVEEDVHSEIRAFCTDLLGDGTQTTLRGIVEEIMLEATAYK